MGNRRLRYWEIEPLIFRDFQIFSGGWTPPRAGPLIRPNQGLVWGQAVWKLHEIEVSEPIPR
jgi:hypothetical protein